MHYGWHGGNKRSHWISDTLWPLFSCIFHAVDCRLPQDGGFFTSNNVVGKITEDRLENGRVFLDNQKREIEIIFGVGDETEIKIKGN